MIRKASLAAMLLTSALLPTQNASAAVTLNGRISEIVNALSTKTNFLPRSFTFSVNTPSGSQFIFAGIGGIRAFTDFETLNTLLTRPSAPTSVFDGAPYKFTHSVLGSYFDQLGDAPKDQNFKLTAIDPVERIAPPVGAAVPEPATWAMMIGGFALAGAALRRRSMAVSLA